MKKKTLLILITVFSVVLAAVFFVFENTQIRVNQERFSSLMVEDLSVITNDRRESDTLTNEIDFNGIPLFFDPASRTFYYSLSLFADDPYDPLVSWESNDVSIAFENRKIDDDLMKENGSIRMLIYDRNRYSVCELKCTNLPLINIEKFYDDPDYFYDRSVITFYDNQTGRYEAYDGEVRIRGGSTTELPKPGLRIELDKVLKGDNNTEEKYYEIFGLEKDNEFVLYTCNIEKDFIRNVFSTNLWYETCADDNDFGLKLGMSYKHCEVFINGKYWGLCALGNPISEKRNYVDLDKDSEKFLLENIYKLNFYGDRERLDYEKYANDYLFAIKTNVEYPEAWRPYIDFIHILLDSEDEEELYRCVDMRNAIDIYLFYNLTQGWDNAWFEDNLKFRNTYLVSKVAEDGTIRFLYVPWDLDKTWGNCVEEGLDYSMDYTADYPMVVTPIENLLEMDDPEIKELLLKRYSEFREDAWSDEKMIRYLDRYEWEVYGSGAFLRDSIRWPDNPHDRDNDLTVFKQYVLKRLHYFDDYMNETFGNDIMLGN